MVSERDRVLNELRGRGLDTEAALAQSVGDSCCAPDIVLVSALGVSVLLLVYYTTVAFGVIYLVEVFHFTPARANLSAELELGCERGGAVRRRRVERPVAACASRSCWCGGLAGAVLIWLFMAHDTGKCHGILPPWCWSPAAVISDGDRICLCGVDGEFHRNDRSA